MADTNKEKEILKKFLPSKLISFFRKMIYPEKIYFLEDDLRSLFLTHYRQLAAADLNQRTAMRNVEFKVFSKYGGDGLLLYIFSMIGATSRTFVEIGVEDGKECNAANLALNFGWQGLMVDANKDLIEMAKSYYRDKSAKVKPVQCFITAENVNQLISANGIQGEIDLLSIDIDGNDYWVWKAISVINPRVVVIEYNASLGFDKSMIIKYNPEYGMGKRPSSLYHGASLPALKKLANAKNYLLAGCDSHGIDAFFVRQDLAEGKFLDLPPEQAYYPHSQRLKDVGSVKEQFEKIKHLDFDRV